jgi:hypothetical protein
VQAGGGEGAFVRTELSAALAQLEASTTEINIQKKLCPRVRARENFRTKALPIKWRRLRG